MAINKALKMKHATPGIYFSESEMTYSQKSLGVTKLGVVGETMRGPAFQVMDVEEWPQFVTYFGGTSTEKFKGSKYPKYELPYIAKEYLTMSRELQVCRVLGLSGVNAGPAWLLTAYKKDAIEGYTKDNPLIIGVLRSRGEHKKAAYVRPADKAKGECEPVYEYDKILYYAKHVSLIPSKTLNYLDGCNPGFKSEEEGGIGDLSMSTSNYGTFTLQVERTKIGDEDVQVQNYAVTLNPNDSNYIVNVLGTNPKTNEEKLIYVEELYDVALSQLIAAGEIDTICEQVSEDNPQPLLEYPIIYTVPKFAPVTDILTLDSTVINNRKYLGKRYLYSKALSQTTKTDANGNEVSSSIKVRHWEDGQWVEAKEGVTGRIYTVIPITNALGTREFVYAFGDDKHKDELTSERKLKGDSGDIFDNCVYVNSMGIYYALSSQPDGDLQEITVNMNDYKESYRYSSTPWVVSEMKGSNEHVELTKLFRFHTISDGSNSSTEVKISIENIDPIYGTFDVIVRDFNDSDLSLIKLEVFKGVDLNPGSPNYIAYRIGSTNEDYETKSKFITVEVNETELTKFSIPAGFLGYPVRCFNGGYAITGQIDENGNFVEGQIVAQNPYLKYNTLYDNEIRPAKQYFGMSDLVGIDTDLLNYKGIEAYNELPNGLTPCFHLDSRIFTGTPDSDGAIENPYSEDDTKQYVTVDGVGGYSWVSVEATEQNTLNDFGVEPRIGTEEVMANTIYEDKRLRKFTMCFYGGWDGWDYYRDSRSNSDDFVYRKYRGNINPVSGEGTNFNVIKSPELYGFDSYEKCITSDYYAYLAAYRTMSNPKTVEINVFATPGVDYVNNKMLVSDVVEFIEEERGDAVYVVTTPDKPFGAGESEFEMYTPKDAVENLEDSEIDSNYVTSSYPWNKFEDVDNNQYIYLPPTKDIVRNFAYTDNIKHPWYAATGWNRGTVNAVRPRKSLKLAEQDLLYEGRLNFTNTFAKDGLRLWGDKNFQIAESPMNRVSHRRALNRIKSLLNKSCVGLLFDPNDPTMAKQLESAVKPVLQDVKDKRGLTDFKLKIDDSQEARDRLELNGQIYIKLMPNLEYINLDIVVTPSGVNLDEV